MRITPDDDFIGVTEDTPVNGKTMYDPDVLYLGALMVYPEAQGVLEEEMERAELMGYDLDNQEIMSGWLKKMAKRIAKRVKSRIRARRAKRKAAPRRPVTITTPRGRVTLGPGGIQYTTRAEEEAAVPEEYAPAVRRGAMPGAGILDMVKANPLLLAIPAGLVALLLLRKRR